MCCAVHPQGLHAQGAVLQPAGWSALDTNSGELEWQVRRIAALNQLTTTAARQLPH